MAGEAPGGSLFGSLTVLLGGKRSYGSGNATYFAYDANGNLAAVTDANASTTYYGYDPLDRLSRITDPAGESEYYHYDAVGNRIAVALANGFANYFEYDALNRQTRISYGDGAAAQFAYDAVGNRIGASDARGWTYYTFDANNRLRSQADPTGREVHYAHDPVGNRTWFAYADRAPYYRYDAANRLTAVTETDLYGWGQQAWGSSAWGGGTPASTFNAYYAYDAVGNATAKVFGGAARADLEYDADERLSVLAWSNAARGELAYFAYDYDAAGRIVRIDREAGTSIYYGRTTGFLVAGASTRGDCGRPEAVGFDGDGDVFCLENAPDGFASHGRGRFRNGKRLAWTPRPRAPAGPLRVYPLKIQ